MRVGELLSWEPEQASSREAESTESVRNRLGQLGQKGQGRVRWLAECLVPVAVDVTSVARDYAIGCWAHVKSASVR